MKKIHTFIAVILLSATGFAQAPEKMSYQAVVRNDAGELVTDQSVGMRISILKTTETGTPVYVETHTSSSNANGLVSIEIGTGSTGSTSNDFSTIDWSSGPYFIKTETDPTGGSSYTILVTSQLMSVPFALHAKVAESVASPTYTVGHWPELGGYVFMISADGKHGLVCETKDQGVLGTSWYNAQNISSDPAFHSMDGSKFTDWRVPTRFELNVMFNKRFAIESFGEIFGSNSYWSSTRFGDTAWRQNFGDGTLYNSNAVTLFSILFVRSVREF